MLVLCDRRRQHEDKQSVWYSCTDQLAGQKPYNVAIVGIRILGRLEVIDLEFVSGLSVDMANLRHHSFHSNVIDDEVGICIEYESANLRNHETTAEFEDRPHTQKLIMWGREFLIQSSDVSMSYLSVVDPLISSSEVNVNLCVRNDQVVSAPIWLLTPLI